MDFVKRFREKAVECYEPIIEDRLVSMCIAGMVTEYKCYLENVSISTFSRLYEFARRTSASVRAPLKAEYRGSSVRKLRSTIVATADSNKRSRKDDYKKGRGDWVEPPPFPCSMKDVYTVLE